MTIDEYAREMLKISTMHTKTIGNLLNRIEALEIEVDNLKHPYR